MTGKDRIISPAETDPRRDVWYERLGWFRDLVAEIEDVHGTSRVRILEPRLPDRGRVTSVWFLPRLAPRVDSTGRTLGAVNTGIHLDLIPAIFRGWGEDADMSIARGGITYDRMRRLAVDLRLLA